MQPFNHLTKIMEGDGPTGAFVLPNYYQMISDLKAKDRALGREAALHPMYAKMIEKLETYQEEALECETLVMATLLHPTFRLKLFTHCWPEKANNAKALLEQHFQKRNDILKKRENDDKLLEKTKPTIINPDNIFDLFEAPETNDKTKELEVYIKNMDRLQGPSAKDPQSLLTWWKVSYLMNRYD